MSETRGGKTVYGASLGILMLETRFPRVPGDMGNALTWPFPVQYRVVKGASPDLVVRGNPMTLLGAFIEAAQDLVRSGCDGLTTNCGFLSLMQRELRAAVPVPVAASSLLQIPLLQRMLPDDAKVGVVTISAETLTNAHLEAAGVEDPSEVPLIGVDPESEFAKGILNDRDVLDFEACRGDVLEASMRLVDNHPETCAIVLECTNMVPYAADIRRETGRPVYSIYSMIEQFHSGLMPRRFAGNLDDPRWRLS